jgi:uncharacterized membrane protein YkoI
LVGKMVSRRNILWLLSAASLVLQSGLVHADDDIGDQSEDDNDDDEHDRALNAVRNYHAASFKEIIAIVEAKFDGEIVNVSIIGSGANLVYRIKLLDEENHLIEVLVGAVSRKIISTKGI